MPTVQSQANDRIAGSSWGIFDDDMILQRWIRFIGFGSIGFDSTGGLLYWGSALSGYRFWIWNPTHQAGGLEAGSPEAQATDFGSGIVLIRLGV